MGCDDTLGAYDGLCERSTVGSEVVGDLVVLPTMPCFVGLTIVVTEVVGLVIDAEEVYVLTIQYPQMRLYHPRSPQLVMKLVASCDYLVS